MLSDKEMLKKVDNLIREQPEIFDALLEFEKTGKVPKFTHKQRVNFTIDAEIIRNFREYCRKKGTKMSTELENCILTKIKNN